MKDNIHRGDIYLADLRPVVGCEQGGIRPVLIVQNDVGNKYSPTTIVVALSSKIAKNPLPTHVPIEKDEVNNLQKDSVALCEQFRTIDKSRIGSKIGKLKDSQTMDEVLKALMVSIGA
jgi:mRNA interferase MazF